MTLARAALGALLALGAVDLMVLNLHLAPRLADELGAPPSVAQAAPRPDTPPPRSEPVRSISAVPERPGQVEVAKAERPAPEARASRPAMEDVRFGLNQWRIDDLRALRDLIRIAEELKANPDWGVLVRGHSDRMGTPQYNVVLSRRRALVVEAVLVTRGVPRERITIEAAGDSQPADPANTPIAWAKNRRVQVFWR